MKIDNYPYPNQDKLENLEHVKKILKEFSRVNKIPEIKIVERDIDSHGCYYWGSEYVIINIKKTRKPINNPGFSWSFTGYKADLTTSGVVAHEFGHFVDYYMATCSEMLKIKGEAKVSSYEPNKKEAFAEMMKLFILNPDLLKVGRPKRWEFLTQTMGLKPVISDSWKKVLENANKKIIIATESWIKKGGTKHKNSCKVA